MNCPVRSEGRGESLLEYCAGRLDASKAAALEAHLEACPACRDFLANQEAVWHALEAWEAPPVSPGFDQRVYRMMERESPSAWWERFRTAWRRPAVPLAATAALLLVAGILSYRPAPAPEQPAQAVEIEQVERALEDLDMLGQWSGAEHAL
ncbi:MAG: zf-HC2 domain-containing protein [Bryobacterales bacterium]|nr:zf-HC2 domain-containing protein [Bryobacterales bacterium]